MAEQRETGVCRDCGQPLRNPESRRRGRGRHCQEKATGRPVKRRPARVAPGKGQDVLDVDPADEEASR